MSKRARQLQQDFSLFCNFPQWENYPSSTAEALDDLNNRLLELAFEPDIMQWPEGRPDGLADAVNILAERTHFHLQPELWTSSYWDTAAPASVWEAIERLAKVVSEDSVAPIP